MIAMIPASFEYLEMFKAVVVGVIILSIFIYAGMLIFIIGKNKERFRAEKLAEHH